MRHRFPKRWGGWGREFTRPCPCVGGAAIELSAPENTSQGEHASGVHVVENSSRAAAINQPRSMVAYVGDIDGHILGQLALERNRPVLVSGHSVGVGANSDGIAPIRHVGSELRREDDGARRASPRSLSPRAWPLLTMETSRFAGIETR